MEPDFITWTDLVTQNPNVQAKQQLSNVLAFSKIKAMLQTPVSLSADLTAKVAHAMLNPIDTLQGAFHAASNAASSPDWYNSLASQMNAPPVTVQTPWIREYVASKGITVQQVTASFGLAEPVWNGYTVHQQFVLYLIYIYVHQYADFMSFYKSKQGGGDAGAVESKGEIRQDNAALPSTAIVQRKHVTEAHLDPDVTHYSMVYDPQTNAPVFKFSNPEKFESVVQEEFRKEPGLTYNDLVMDVVRTDPRFEADLMAHGKAVPDVARTEPGHECLQSKDGSIKVFRDLEPERYAQFRAELMAKYPQEPLIRFMFVTDDNDPEYLNKKGEVATSPFAPSAEETDAEQLSTQFQVEQWEKDQGKALVDDYVYAQEYRYDLPSDTQPHRMFFLPMSVVRELKLKSREVWEEFEPEEYKKVYRYFEERLPVYKWVPPLAQRFGDADKLFLAKRRSMGDVQEEEEKEEKDEDIQKRSRGNGQILPILPPVFFSPTTPPPNYKRSDPKSKGLESLAGTTTGHSNWSKSVSTHNRVFKVNTAQQLQNIMVNHVQNEPHIRVVSGGHDYSHVTVPGTGFQALLLDLSEMQEITWDEKRQWLGVEPGVTLETICDYLERKKLVWTMRNHPACMNLTAAGCFMMASHGSGDLASFVDQVVAVEFLAADGSLAMPKYIERDGSDQSDFQALAGSMGVLGVVTKVWIKPIPLVKLHDEHISLDGLDALQAQLKKETSTFKSLPSAFDTPGVFDQIYWTPIADHFMYFRRREPQGHDEQIKFADLSSEPSGSYNLGDALTPAGAKLINGARHWGFSSKWSAKIVADSYALQVRKLPEYNTLSQLNAPITEVTRRMRDAYDMSNECEIFFPVQSNGEIVYILSTFNDLFKVVMGNWSVKDTKWIESGTHKLVEKHKLLSLLEDLTGKYALYTSPLEVRFLPATETCAMAPNYKTNCMALSMPWFGTREHFHESEQIFRFFLRFATLVWDAVPHWGKYNMLHEVNTERDIIELWMRRFQEGRQRTNVKFAAWGRSGRCSTPILDSFFDLHSVKSTTAGSPSLPMATPKSQMQRSIQGSGQAGDDETESSILVSDTSFSSSSLANTNYNERQGFISLDQSASSSELPSTTTSTDVVETKQQYEDIPPVISAYAVADRISGLVDRTYNYATTNDRCDECRIKTNLRVPGKYGNLICEQCERRHKNRYQYSIHTGDDGPIYVTYDRVTKKTRSFRNSPEYKFVAMPESPSSVSTRPIQASPIQSSSSSVGEIKAEPFVPSQFNQDAIVSMTTFASLGQKIQKEFDEMVANEEKHRLVETKAKLLAKFPSLNPYVKDIVYLDVSRIHQDRIQVRIYIVLYKKCPVLLLEDQKIALYDWLRGVKVGRDIIRECITSGGIDVASDFFNISKAVPKIQFAFFISPIYDSSPDQLKHMLIAEETEHSPSFISSRLDEQDIEVQYTSQYRRHLPNEQKINFEDLRSNEERHTLPKGKAMFLEKFPHWTPYIKEFEYVKWELTVRRSKQTATADIIFILYKECPSEWLAKNLDKVSIWLDQPTVAKAIVTEIVARAGVAVPGMDPLEMYTPVIERMETIVCSVPSPYEISPATNGLVKKRKGKEEAKERETRVESVDTDEPPAKKFDIQDAGQAGPDEAKKELTEEEKRREEILSLPKEHTPLFKQDKAYTLEDNLSSWDAPLLLTDDKPRSSGHAGEEAEMSDDEEGVIVVDEDYEDPQWANAGMRQTVSR